MAGCCVDDISQRIPLWRGIRLRAHDSLSTSITNLDTVILEWLEHITSCRHTTQHHFPSLLPAIVLLVPALFVAAHLPFDPTS